MNIQLKDVDNVVFNGIDVSAVKFNDVLVWQKWETIEYTGAVPVTIYANGEPLIELLISGNMSQSGTPTPTTPIQPQECGERTGNLFDYTAITTGYRIQWTTGNDYPDDTAVRSDYIPVSSGTYSCSDSVIVLGYDASKNYMGATNGDGVFEKMAKTPTTQFTILANSDCKYIKILSFYNAQTPMNIDAETMLNSGSTALPYSPYGYKLDISSGDTTTPVYLGEVETERKIKKVKLSAFSWTAFDEGGVTMFRAWPPLDRDYGYGVGTMLCSAYPIYNIRISLKTVDYGAAPYNNTNTNYLVVRDKDYTNASEFTRDRGDVEFWYVLAEPTTGILNEPLRKIGNYADSLSVSQTIPTVEGSNVVDVETTLKPSEVYIKYKGKS